MTDRIQSIKNNKIKSIRIGKYYDRKIEDINKINKRGIKIKDVYNIGQRIFIDFDNTNSMIFAPGMTGKTSFIPSKYDVIIITLLDGKKIYFNDVRKISHTYVMDEITKKKYISKKLGYDPFYHKNLSFKQFYDQYIEKRKNSKRIVALILMDDRIFAGTGNYIRAEVLYDTRIDPFCKFKDLDKSLIKKLFLSFRKIIYNSYNYQIGKKSSFEFKAYGRKDKSEIDRKVINGRSLWYFPKRIKYKC